ncbi:MULTISPECIES: flotillin domain-containing protein [unclassified Agrobacterium]|jgi:flotillin|uniref:flotillin family protein n=1 Tax=unclassified Agrobacterium TaxID=2632611 RepID=UPI000DB72862|nr:MULTISPECIES: flotillin domain-containing protein [unclassified Agrobacterium]PZR80262.1 MAG: flotillin [Stutzerimonas stutzeri]MDH0614899.1 SPFH domain-containing protein [Agrobacterium sp. GD03872]MDH0699557.1 SPFH domain-containing protein [Agrobacterium sp. GD03871]MDH1061961.1 SPFH domain-containing protein [Agrobacterium sp. GD03992]MDH2211669.1 SPFH domain-containing protein [Agrobacterium sp. GD03643]
MDFFSLSLIAGGIVTAVVVIGIIMTSLYTRSTRDKAYVRTGLGGKKVVLDGGAIILPIFHSYSWVSLSTLRLEVKRSEHESLITKDRMRADITAEFYVRVKPDAENIALAAQTLGDRTNDADALKSLVEAKFVDGLRSVAATMSLRDLQEQRAEFVKSVQAAVAHDLQSNGLELESVSLTRLDQTDIKHFNPNNSFDAEGLTALTRITEERKRERNQIVRDNEVEIATKDREAVLRRLTIEREQRDAELTQERDIANKTAETRAEAARAEQAARLNEETAKLDTERGIAERDAQARQARETARIEAERGIAEREAEARKITETARIEAAIAVAQKVEQEQAARAKADEAKASAITAEEQVATAREVEIAERAKRIAVIDARKAAEQEATAITVKAEAERQAAENLAAATKIGAEAEAQAAKIRAEGVIALGDAEAQAERAKNDARNALSGDIIAFELARARIAIIPEALSEAMKPIEKISDIRIFSAGNLAGALGGGGDTKNGNGLGDLSSQLLSFTAQKPVLDEILAQAGFKGADPTQALLAASITNAADQPASEKQHRKET